MHKVSLALTLACHATAKGRYLQLEGVSMFSSIFRIWAEEAKTLGGCIDGESSMTEVGLHVRKRISFYAHEQCQVLLSNYTRRNIAHVAGV